MKLLISCIGLLVAAVPSVRAQTSSTASAVPPNASGYTVAERGANHRTWQRIEWETGPSGEQIPHVHRYTEIATGMAHLVGNHWVDSSAEIQVTATGAHAINAQHSVSFLGNLNSAGAVRTTTPEGKHLVSNILGLSYFDAATSNMVMIAEVKDSAGQLLPSKDRALFPDAFSGVRQTVEGGARGAFRRANRLVGGFIHHANPIKGHPNGTIARYPLPFQWAARGAWNMKWVPTRAAHMAEHSRMLALEAVDEVREATILVRQAGNEIALYLEGARPCSDWTVHVSASVSGTSAQDGPIPPTPSATIHASAQYSESGVEGGGGD